MAKVKEPTAIYSTSRREVKRSQPLTPKNLSLQLLHRLKDDASFDDIMYELYVLQKIKRGLNEIEKGEVVTHAEAKKRLSRWLK